MTAVGPGELDALAGEIRTELQAADDSWRDTLAHAIRAGELLIEAKGKVGHGEWLPWLEGNFPGSDRTARNYMRLASNRQRVANLPTVREAMALLSEPKERDDTLIAEEAWERLRSVQELQSTNEAATAAAATEAADTGAITREAAERVTDLLSRFHAALFDLLAYFYDVGLHEALGYSSWAEFVDRRLFDVSSLPEDLPAWLYVHYRQQFLAVEGGAR